MITKRYALGALRCDAGHDLAETRAKAGHCRLCWNAYHREWKANNLERARQLSRDSMRRMRKVKLAADQRAWLAQP
jgi:hypothetical protein